ncbi:Serine-type D-Ala-D-Ala carboxypeptidase [Sulfobacillus acidophilus TPY]|uniref:serine-type D-Ala-D-Ala carboxypeptidase n=1 Tax=Sulfobacillus acidophilus (strain ATCC 700253 / DSM 10332 / NAL) TaxID=679936 RepID=G8U034_SULAD|nr:Serine-type D-Ala-D-Ala carboxypeptidase [Sulfobacillus acidophilus TPY]AEW05283.1 Serine-type D-Ala-D-Ala carboxypeptidase [Sulfobacillus acidophilus DSM 10332]
MKAGAHADTSLKFWAGGMDVRQKHWSVWLFAGILGWIPLGTSGGGVYAANLTPPAPVSAKAAELLDGQSGRVLYEKNAYEKLPMASVTKLMTLVLVLQAVHAKKLGLNELVPVSEEAYRVGGSQIWLEPGERMTVEQLIRAVAVGSANDAAYALGEYLAGSPDAFVAEMNRTARQWGMVSTHFANPHGLHDPNHYTTAHDLGILALHALHTPGLLDYTRMREDRTIRNGKGGTLWLVNSNRLLRTYPGTDGLKTGYTSQAGFCLVATAKRGDTRMVSVILGAPSSKNRFHDAAELMTWGFMHYETVAIARKGQLFGTVRIRRGTQRMVGVQATSDAYVTVPKDQTALTRTVVIPPEVGAPVTTTRPIGKIVVKQGSQVLMTVSLYPTASVPALGWGQGVWRWFWRITG